VRAAEDVVHGRDAEVVGETGGGIRMLDRCLVTGGAGFIGSHIVDGLVDEGMAVRVVDDLSTGDRANLRHVIEDVEFIEGDIRDTALMRKAMKGVRYVFHEAALPSVQRSVEDPFTTNAVNVEGTLSVLVAARDAGVARLVYASSSSVYGDVPVSPKHEGLKPEPRSPYATSKLAGEYYCQTFFRTYALETVALRYFNVFGPRQRPDSAYAAVVPSFFACLQRGARPIVFGDGEQTRDFTYVGNVVQANLLSAKAEAVAGEVFNVACGERFSINQLLAAMSSILGKTPTPAEYAPPREGDVRHSLADINKARSKMGYRVRIGLDQGLALTLKQAGTS
jgi:UDP-glucose 4-epimerase